MLNVMTKTSQKDVIYALLTPTEHYANAAHLPSNSSLLEPLHEKLSLFLWLEQLFNNNMGKKQQKMKSEMSFWALWKPRKEY